MDRLGGFLEYLAGLTGVSRIAFWIDRGGPEYLAGLSGGLLRHDTLPQPARALPLAHAGESALVQLHAELEERQKKGVLANPSSSF